MNTTPARLLVAVADSEVFVRISGRANFAVSLDFKTLIHELRARGYVRFTLDLTECLIMDSTFLGVLAGFSLKLAASEPDKKASVRVLNPSARIADAFDTMGIASLFDIQEGSPPLAEYTEATPAPAASKLELTRTSLEAHQTLMSIAPGNIPKFKDVAQFLAEDLKKLEAGQYPSLS